MFSPFIALAFRCVARAALGGDPAAPLWIVDIDNTVARSWPSFLEKHVSEAGRLASIRPLEGMCGRVREAACSGARVVFMTVRPYWAYFITRRWLSAQGLPSGVWNVVLVRTPEEKLELLRAGLIRCRSRVVEYYDDLSSRQETGKVEFYSDLIERARGLPLKYVGYEEIAAINGRR